MKHKNKLRLVDILMIEAEISFLNTEVQVD